MNFDITSVFSESNYTTEKNTDLETKLTVGEQTDNYIQRTYQWNYAARQWTWTINIHEDHYNYFKNLKRPMTDDYSIYVTNEFDDAYIESLVSKFKSDTKKYGFTERETVDFIVAFVQSLKYVLDDVSTGYDEYPKYPLETLVDQQGDCEDTSILLASLLREMGYGVVLIMFPDHMGVGVKGSPDMPGHYFEYEGSRYYYVETTGSGWGIGNLPDEYRGQKAKILPLISRPVITHSWKSQGTPQGYKVTVTLNNEGTAVANNTKVYVAFDAGNGMVYDQAYSEPISIPPQTKQDITINLKYPKSVKTRIIVKIVVDDKLVQQSQSDWWQT
ncbi:hypothetical protein V6C27_04120 [Peptococcaceae bacterium 1198_IL3148]